MKQLTLEIEKEGTLTKVTLYFARDRKHSFAEFENWVKTTFGDHARIHNAERLKKLLT